MSALVWDESGTRRYETGTDRGVLYLYDATTREYQAGIAWNNATGLNSMPDITEKTYNEIMSRFDKRAEELSGATA